MSRRSSSWALPLLLLGLRPGDDLAVRDQQHNLVRRIDEAELSREAHLVGYMVAEHYTIRNSHFSRPAEAVVRTNYKRGQGKAYTVLSRTGSSLLANSVLDRLLREESQMSRGVARQGAIITSANYDMQLVAREPLDGTMCDVVELTPKRKSPYLLKGRMWLDAADTTLVKIEGKPPTSASLFEGRPQISREYRKIDGFALAVHSHAVSTNLFLGKSIVDIEYRDYRLITSGR